MLRRWSLLAVVAFIACRQPQATPPPDVAVRLAASSASGNFFSDAQALTDAVTRALPHVRLELLNVGGGLRNVNMLREGKADVAFSFSNVAYAVHTAPPETNAANLQDLRGIAVLDVAPLHLLVGPKSTVHSVADLRGKRIDPGGPGSGAAQAFNAVLLSYGLTAADVEIAVTGYDAGIKQLVNGGMDAMFILGNYPSEPVRRAIKAGARLLPITGPEVDRLRADFPFFVPALINAAGYSGVDTALHTIGVESLLLCRADLPGDVVYLLTQAIFSSTNGTASLAQSRNWSDVKQAAATPIPLHPGAARYYRERELSP
jgi:TRAP transporter TAXI family solute receptor